jgi:hypothetical protein
LRIIDIPSDRQSGPVGLATTLGVTENNYFYTLFAGKRNLKNDIDKHNMHLMLGCANIHSANGIQMCDPNDQRI